MCLWAIYTSLRPSNQEQNDQVFQHSNLRHSEPRPYIQHLLAMDGAMYPNTFTLTSYGNVSSLVLQYMCFCLLLELFVLL